MIHPFKILIKLYSKINNLLRYVHFISSEMMNVHNNYLIGVKRRKEFDNFLQLPNILQFLHSFFIEKLFPLRVTWMTRPVKVNKCFCHTWPVFMPSVLRSKSLFLHQKSIVLILFLFRNLGILKI